MGKKIIRDEIGSEFWSVPVAERKTHIFPDDMRWFVSGTSALKCILRDIRSYRKIKSAAIPSWCCGCMIEPFLDQGIAVSFYTVAPDENGRLFCDYSSAPPCDLTLVISYFGYSDQNVIGEPSGLVVRDLTHSLFCPGQADADYYFGSLRKWAGFLTGGYAWKKGEWTDLDEVEPIDPAYAALRKDAMQNKLRYLRGEREDKGYLQQFEQAEDYLDHIQIMKGDAEDRIAALHFDAESVRKNRLRNARILLGELDDLALFRHVEETDCPLFFPILLDTKQREGLRRYLIEERIYCPVHWEITDSHRLTIDQRFLYDHELSIVCDQRYGPDEMDRIVKTIRTYLKDKE